MFRPGFDASLVPAVGDLALVVANERLVLLEQSLLVPVKMLGDVSVTLEASHYLGLWQESRCFLIQTSTEQWPEPWQVANLRQLLSWLDAPSFALAARALQLTHWFTTHRFCGACGAPTAQVAHERALHCTACTRLFYPKVAPCVIGLVWRDKQLLLARNARFKPGYYSILAGFIETAETAEQALAREVEEEVGVTVHTPHYVCSQPWPFPSQLMLGFFAQYRAGTLRPDGVEIIEAQWFDFDRLPDVPPAETISGRLIRRFVQQCERD